MSKPGIKRRLAAILAADVVGYSRMMGKDESGTLNALKRHRSQVFNPAVEAHNGRVVKLIGDGTLAEFPSVVDAVNCAVSIQRAVFSLNDADGVVLRIGINLGDVIIDGDDIYGDGVNVAARLEPLAESGGICISSIVNESVGSRANVMFRDGGEVQVKNIERLIRVWKWQPGETHLDVNGTRPPDLEPASKKPSIAVLAFDNMSGDTEQEYFSDGITEDIITDLSKASSLIVIARNSSFAYKGKKTDIRTIGSELGVDTVLEGSIRRAGNRVRITAQLIDTTTGAHVWAERYDRDLTDIFAVQDEVTNRIVDALKVSIAPDEAARIADAPTKSLEAHDLFLRARELLFGAKKDREMFDQVIWLLSRAIDLDPDYAEPYAGLAMAHNLNFQNHWTDATDALEVAVHYVQVAGEKGPLVPYVHYVAAVLCLWQRNLNLAKQECKTALTLNPNYAMAYATHALVETFSGNPLAALPLSERAMRLDPGFAQQYLHFLGTAYLVAGKYETAAATYRERIRLVPETDLTRGLLVSALGHLGETEEARRVSAELKEINPNYSFSDHLSRLPFANPADTEHIQAGLAKTGHAD